MAGKNLDEPIQGVPLEEFMEKLAKECKISKKRRDDILRAIGKANVPMLNIGQFLQTVCTNDDELCYMSLHLGIMFGTKITYTGA